MSSRCRRWQCERQHPGDGKDGDEPLQVLRPFPSAVLRSFVGCKESDPLLPQDVAMLHFKVSVQDRQS